MVGVLLILWYTYHFYGCRIVDTLRYLSFLWLVYCWNFGILSISVLFIPLVVPILDICASRYCSIPSISRFDTDYIACWKRENSKSTHWCPRIDVPFPPFPFACFLSVPPHFLAIFSVSDLGTFLSVSFEWHADARCGSLASRYWCPFFSLCHCFYSFCISSFYTTSELTESLYE